MKSAIGLTRREWLRTAAGASALLAAPRVSDAQASKVQLSMCLSDNDRTRPLREGRVKADGLDLVISTAHPSEMFWRELHFAEFDVSEMSCSSLLMAVAHGDQRFVAIPVFTSRSFFHTGILVRTDRGVEKPQDLKGKKVAVPEYQQTAALWCRGALQHEFGVSPLDINWYMERTEELSHASATGFEPPKGLKFQHIPENENIGTMLLDGKIDASLLYLNEVNLVDRSRVDLRNRKEVRTLFKDPEAEGIRYYRKTGFYPINHCVVFKREVAEKYPWAVLNVFKAFDDAKNSVREQGRTAASVYFELGLVSPDQKRALEADPYAYGVKANRSVLEAITQFSFEQGLTPRKLKLERYFMRQRWISKRLPRSLTALAAAMTLAALPFVAPRTQAQDQQPQLSADDIADGMRLYQQKADCQACHGWAGDGHKTDSQMPTGANLRETKLNRSGLINVIKCGRLNSQMPAFDKFAYSDGRCYGKKQVDLKSYPTRMPDPPSTLQQREIDLIADFLLAKIVGKGPMDHAKCVEFWGSETAACKDLPK